MGLHSNRGPNSGERGEEENVPAKNVHGRQWAATGEGAPGARRQLPTPSPAPACPGSQCCLGFTSYLFEQEELPLLHAAFPRHLQGLGHRLGLCKAAFLGLETKRGDWPLPLLTTLSPHLPSPFPVWVKEDTEGTGCQFHFPTPGNSCHFLYLSSNRVVGAKQQVQSSQLALTHLLRASLFTQHPASCDPHPPGQARRGWALGPRARCPQKTSC